MRSGSAAIRFVRVRPRLLTGLALGILAALLLPGAYRPVTRALIGWNAAVWWYLALTCWLMARASPARVRSIAEREDPSAAVVLTLMCFTAIMSLAAIVMELAAVRQMTADARASHYALTVGTLLGSWLFVNTMFTLHYARMYYRAAADRRPLRFPGDAEALPDYWDFLYFSFTIAVAAQTSDVSVTGRAMRRAVLGHSVLGFLFNVAIIGLSINVAAGLIGS